MMRAPISSKSNSAALAGRDGFTLFEFAVVVSVIGILATVLLNSLAYYQEQAQRAMVAQTLGVLRASLRLRAVELRVAGKQNQLPALAGENPMDWLSDKPSNYLGVYDQAAIKNLPSASWFFEKNDKTLTYLLRRGSFFWGTQVDVLKFKVILPQLGADAETLLSAPDIVAETERVDSR